MSHLHSASHFGVLLGSFAAVALAGCDNESPKPSPSAPVKENQASVEAKNVTVGKNVVLEIRGDQRRVRIQTLVCLREGQLEQLMCRKHTKEHEAILTADVDARDIHKALLLTGVEPGSTVQYEPKYKAPSGPKIAVRLEWEEKGKLRTERAQQWVKNAQTGKALEDDWVFAGSILYPDPFAKDKPPIYGANSGDVICVSNFEDALLDLPIKSSKENAELVYEAFTERIPPIDTPVTVILEPLEIKKPATKK